MFTLMIVEDELFMSDFLVNFIDWNSIDVSVCGVYQDGQSALAGIMEKRPNLVLTDINMPVMNGLELIERVREQQLDTKFVIISGYNDFHLVKGAFKLGVTDYFLKTELDPDNLKNFVWKMKFTETGYAFKTGIDKKEPVLKDLFRGLKSVEEAKKSVKLDIRGQKAVLVADLLNYEQILKNQFKGNQELLRYGILNILDELLEPEEGVECFLEEYDEAVFLISDEEAARLDGKVRELAEKTGESLRQCFGFVMGRGYACAGEKQEGLGAVYNRAKQAAGFSFIRGRDGVYSYDALSGEREALRFDKSQRIVGFENYIFDFEFDELLKNFGQFLIEDAAFFQMDLVTEIYRSYFVVLNHFSNKHPDFDLEGAKFEQILRMGTLAQLNQYFTDVAERLAELYGYTSNIVARVQKYINENYSKNLSLQSLADDFQIDYKKLSRLFKIKTGKSFKKYITDIRMKEALQLIRETDYLLYEISELVGYNNYANFSRVFMKYYNKWPKDVERS